MLVSAMLLCQLGAAVVAPGLRVDVVLEGVRMTPPVEATAMKEVTRIWTAYGVDVRAVHRDEPVREGAVRLEVTVVRQPERAADSDVLGSIRFVEGVPQPAIRMFPDRIAALADAAAPMRMGDALFAPVFRNYTLGRVFGRALAHEIGHFLLRSRTHSHTGLMRAHPPFVELAAFEWHSFALTASEVSRLASFVPSLCD